MKEKALKINKKDYNILKSLSDRDFGTLVRALCEYVYYGIDASFKDKILKVYYDNFRIVQRQDFESVLRQLQREDRHGKFLPRDGQARRTQKQRAKAEGRGKPLGCTRRV